jgi:hypothetical protein
MSLTAIRNSVRSLFNEIGEAAITATLRRKSNDSYVPGSSPAVVVTDYSVRLLTMDLTARESRNETDRILEPALQHALIESEEIAPRVDDDLVIADTVVTLQQVVAADLGAGILYEVFYQ